MVSLNSDTPTILVVDDERIVRNVVVRILEKAEYKVLLAEDGYQAMKITDTFPGKIQVVLLDLIMPELSGIDLFPMLRDALPETRIILCSGYGGANGTATKLITDGAFYYIKKPFKTEQLLTEVQKALD